MASRSLPVALTTATVLLAALAGCAPQDQPPPGPAPAACTKADMKTKTPGKLTIGTDDPAYEPWFSENTPANGKGFESAVAYEVAKQLGYARVDVQWVRVKFDNAIAPGAKEFDFDINQFSITDERKVAVDFSSPYYLVRQAVVAAKGSKIAGKSTLADLKNAKLGAQVGTTSYQAITDLIKPTVKAQVYNSNDDAKKALQNGQLDGIVVDLPTAFYITSAEIKDATIVGQLPQVGVPETFGLLLDKDSPLSGCVSNAVNALRESGKLVELEKTWLADVAGAAELT
ncbi:ABC transporter substrate-binding protein [Plantactinospora solaniradicis]|uniref:ABC transporter substrate-binding protein n=1 Tax=Plantactinospora solaniradicis TaxID=1723736 RepID=A0ABW1KPB7_9ACTN